MPRTKSTPRKLLHNAPLPTSRLMLRMRRLARTASQTPIVANNSEVTGTVAVDGGVMSDQELHAGSPVDTAADVVDSNDIALPSISFVTSVNEREQLVKEVMEHGLAFIDLAKWEKEALEALTMAVDDRVAVWESEMERARDNFIRANPGRLTGRTNLKVTGLAMRVTGY